MSRRREEDFKGIMHFHYMTYMATFYHNYFDRWGYEIHNVGRPFPSFHSQYVRFVLSILRSREEHLKINQFYAFYLKVSPFEFEGYEVYNFLSPYHTNATYQIW